MFPTITRSGFGDQKVLITGDVKEKILRYCAALHDGRITLNRGQDQVEKWCKTIPGLSLQRFRDWRSNNRLLIREFRRTHPEYTQINSDDDDDDDDDNDGDDDDDGDFNDDTDTEPDDVKRQRGPPPSERKFACPKGCGKMFRRGHMSDHLHRKRPCVNVPDASPVAAPDVKSSSAIPERGADRPFKKLKLTEPQKSPLHAAILEAEAKRAKLSADISAMRATLETKERHLETTRAAVAAALAAKLAAGQTEQAALEAERNALLARSAEVDSQIAGLKGAPALAANPATV